MSGGEEKKQGFIVFYDTMDALEEYTEAEVGSFIRAMAQFARFGVVPDFKDRGLRVLWKYAQQALERGEAAYQKRCQQNRYNSYVSVEKRRFRRDHPGLGDPKEGKDYLSFEDWAEQIDGASASERFRVQANASEADPTITEAGEVTGIGAKQEPEQRKETVLSNYSSVGNREGDTGEQTLVELQIDWREARQTGDNRKALDISNMLFRLGYNIDPVSGELSRRT